MLPRILLFCFLVEVLLTKILLVEIKEILFTLKQVGNVDFALSVEDDIVPTFEPCK